MAESYTIHGAEVKTRHPLAPLGLGIITLGIYQLVWWFKINREVRDVAGDGNPGMSLLAVTLGALVIVPPLVSAFNTASRIATLQQRNGAASPVNPVLALVMLFVPIANLVFTPYLQNGLNKAWEALLPASALRDGSQAAPGAAPTTPVGSGWSTPPVPPARD